MFQTTYIFALPRINKHSTNQKLINFTNLQYYVHKKKSIIIKFSFVIRENHIVFYHEIHPKITFQ